MMQGLNKDSKIPKFLVTARAEDLADGEHQEHIRNSEMVGRSSPKAAPVGVLENHSQFQSCY